MAHERRFDRDFERDDRWSRGRGEWRGGPSRDRQFRTYDYERDDFGYGRERDFGDAPGYRRGSYMSGEGERYPSRSWETQRGGYERGGWGEREREWPRDERSFSRQDYGSTYGRGYDRDWSERGYRSRGGGGESWPSESRQERGFFDKASDEVSSWFGDEEAERRRRQDQMHYGRGPKNYTRSDERIREDVCDRLTDDGMVDASDIEVEVKGSEVTLSGNVPDRMQRHRAEYCTERVSGVSHVQNNLRVSSSASQVANPLGTGTGAMSNATGSGLRTGKTGSF
jgi:osmotically-inducible protein OsmY